MDNQELTKKRLRELAQKSYQNNQYTFTGFLNMAELSEFYEMEQELSYASYTIWGGSELCERVMIRFGSIQELGYEEEFPIACIQVKPLMAKFAEELTHRDFLGALMNLGIERSTLGDILLEENTGYIFCMENMADFIIENLSRVKHTSMLCCRTQETPKAGEKDWQEVIVQVSSERVDGMIARVYQLSRNDAVELFRQKRVFVNGRQCENNSLLLKPEDVISVRGYGKFIYSGSHGISKKGKINAIVLCYGKR